MTKTKTRTSAPAPDPGDLLTIDQAAHKLSVSKGTVRNLMDTGELSAFRVGSARAVRIPKANVLGLLSSYLPESGISGVAA